MMHLDWCHYQSHADCCGRDDELTDCDCGGPWVTLHDPDTVAGRAQVDQVARAHYDALRLADIHVPWDFLSPGEQQVKRKQARAAVKALRGDAS